MNAPSYIGRVIVLPYPVSSNRYWRSFVPKGHSRAIVTRSDEAKSYIATVRKLLMVAGLSKPLDGWVYVRMRLYPNRPQDWAKRAQKDPDGWEMSVQCLDVGNCEKVLSDALNGIVWHDDKQIRLMILERMSPDEHGERLTLEVMKDPTPLVQEGLFA
jgi:crossover junction endodeoxyribonuclease RusA